MELNVKNTTLKKSLSVVNCLFGMTDTELDIATLFLKSYLNGDKPFSVEGKRAIALTMGKDEYLFLNMYLSKLKTKHVISSTKNNYTFHPIIKQLADKPTTLTFKFDWNVK